MLKPFLISLQFLTCIPVNFKSPPANKELGHSVIFYPAIGLIIGLILFITTLLGPYTHSYLAAALTLTTWTIITGALHLDGLADTVDGWFGGLGSRQRTLDIMKDSHIGAMGVVSLIIILIFKFSAIISLLINEYNYYIIFVPVIARTVPIILLLTTSYAREQGIAENLFNNIEKEKTWATCITVFVILILLKPLLFLITIALCLAYLGLWRYFLIKRLGGFTGDTVGGLIETTELLMLIILAVY